MQTLPQEQRQRLAADMAQLLLLLARATAWQPGERPGRSAAEKALRLNEAAAATDAGMAATSALWHQRAELRLLLGQEAEAKQCRAKANEASVRTSQDLFLLASDHLGAGRVREALPLLQQATWQDPQHFWSWFVLGNCHERQGRDAREACYAACIALWPNFPWSHFNRGLAYLRQQEYLLARADFDRVIELRPDLAEGYLNRALARQALKHYAEAEQDLTQALQRDASPTRLYFLRARVREKLGDQDGARKDHDEGMRRRPADEKSFLARGYASWPPTPRPPWRTSRRPCGSTRARCWGCRTRPTSSRRRWAAMKRRSPS